MKAWVLESPHCLRFTDIPVPVCGESEILVKIITSCLCNGSDPAILSGATWSQFPVVFGHETFGEVVEAGCKTRGFKAGDRVSWWFTMGAFAEYTAINPETVAVALLPGDIDRLEAPVFELAIAAFRAISVADVQGKRVLIVGLGPSGLIMAQLCRALGARLVSGWDLYDMRLKLGEAFGCAGHDGDYDIVIDAFGDDTSGDRQTVNRAVERLRDFGTMVLYGHPENGRLLNSYLLQKKQIQVKMPVNDIKVIQGLANQAVRLYQNGKLELKRLITDVVALPDVEDALALLRKEPDRHIKIIVSNEGV